MKLKDIKKLADLARIDMKEEEMIEIAESFDSILAYVGQVQEALKTGKSVPESKKSNDYFLHNIMREDIITNNRGEYTEVILSNAPEAENGFLKVKQIL